MLQSIEIKNFKSIKKKYFPLRNLNVLLGLNGQGKSSFIQALLLFRQSADNLKSGDLCLNGSDINIGTTKDALYQYSKKNENLAFEIKFENKEPIQLEFNYTIEADFFSETKTLSSITNNPILENIAEPLFSKNFQYLNAHRVEPKSIHPKNYSSVVVNKNLGNYGEFTAHFIETYYNDEVEFENVIHPASITKDDVLKTIIINKTLIHQINLWMGEISPGVSVRTTTIPNTEDVLLEYVFKQPNYGNTNRYKPENVGFGISYALHIVTALLASRPGELIILENPESHIHPKGQAQLGKLIALVAQNDVQVIIETHSDHILNGIRVGIKENPIMKDRTVLFYFKKIVTDNEQYSQVTDIEIDKNGTLSEYPENLLDEWSNQLSKLI